MQLPQNESAGLKAMQEQGLREETTPPRSSRPLPASAARNCESCGYPLPDFALQCQQPKCGAYVAHKEGFRQKVEWLNDLTKLVIFGPIGVIIGAYIFNPEIRQTTLNTLLEPRVDLQLAAQGDVRVVALIRNAGQAEVVLQDVQVYARHRDATNQPISEYGDMLKRLSGDSGVLQRNEAWSEGVFEKNGGQSPLYFYFDDTCRVVMRVLFNHTRSATKAIRCPPPASES